MNTDTGWADRYFAAVDRITAEWQHLIDALRAEDTDASMWQTGGMTMLIGWTLDKTTGAYAMLSTSNGGLCHERADENFPDNDYYVGVYLHAEDWEGDGVCVHVGKPHNAADDEAAAKVIVRDARALYGRLLERDRGRRLQAGHAAFRSVWCHAGVPTYRVRGAPIDTGVVHGPQQQ